MANSMMLMFHPGDLDSTTLLLLLFLFLVFVAALGAAFIFVIYLIAAAWNHDKAARKARSQTKDVHSEVGVGD